MMSTKRKFNSDETDEKTKDVSNSVLSKKIKVKMTVEEYDKFLLEKKEGRFKRTGEWKGMHTRVSHQCSDPECARQWAPTPVQCLADDYYCPSCVLHHRNNLNRFTEERLKWTANVPNTFYVFSIVDPGHVSSGKEPISVIKFGRTQHVDALKRYPTAELRAYKMKLILSLRGKLILTTRIENWWKEQAEENGWFFEFSNSKFHGQTECIQVNDTILNQLISKSKEMVVDDDKTEIEK